jgi:uncharacterized protein (TIGR04255 family)
VNRPAHLPDFERPPLNEVVLGVQFSPSRRYHQIYAKDVWELFRQEFPKVTEQPPLPPIFETFGRPQRPRLNIELVREPVHSRYWFISENEYELIQYQKDRLLHNWRKVGDGANPYPRFESILPKFEKELFTLEKLFEHLFDQKMNITQCELTYINHILLTEENGGAIGKWISLINTDDAQIEDIAFSFRKTLNDEENKPYGRLIVDCKTGINQKDERLLVLELTVRGIPKEPNVSAISYFLKDGRQILVTYFDQITTELAHEKWGKK